MEKIKKELNYFDILGVDENVDISTLKQAYKKLAKEYHPDKYQDPSEKKRVEKEFKVIKKAYDVILEELAFNQEKNKVEAIENIVSNEDFISFFTNHNINKTKTWENAKKNDSSYKEAYKFIATQIEKFNIDWLYVYECIRRDKMFINWEVNNKVQLQKILLKETMFRKTIKNSSLYNCFLENRKLFLNPNIKLEINLNPLIMGKKVEQKISYTCPSVCDSCSGNGCHLCQNGIILKEINRKLKFSDIENRDFFEVENSGFLSDICNGSLYIKFIFNTKQKEGLKIKQENNFNYNTKTKIIDSLEKTQDIFASYYHNALEFIKKHHIHLIYSTVIVILLIIIIILAAVLG